MCGQTGLFFAERLNVGVFVPQQGRKIRGRTPSKFIEETPLLGHDEPMPAHALFAGLTTVDVIHALDHAPDLDRKATSVAYAISAGGPATNAAVTFSALETLRPCPAHASNIRGNTILLSALGRGNEADLLVRDLHDSAVHVLDATAENGRVTEKTRGQNDQTYEKTQTDPHTMSPAVSSVIEHPNGRIVASTNARLSVDVDKGAALLDETIRAAGPPSIVMVDGHNPGLAELALLVGVPHDTSSSESGSSHNDPFALLEAKPPHLRVLDGGSWKPWFLPLLGLIDVAVISADFCPPILTVPEGEVIADFLRGFGIGRVIRTRGPKAVQWWWDGRSGTVDVPTVNAISTMGAGDIFHGALCWALADLPHGGRTLEDPSEVIDFACRVAAVSTTRFGTREWRTDPQVADAVTQWVAAHT